MLIKCNINNKIGNLIQEGIELVQKLKTKLYIQGIYCLQLYTEHILDL